MIARVFTRLRPLRRRVQLLFKHGCYYGTNGLDRTVAKYLPQHTGFFVELGANDGLTQSNTLYLERHRGWVGILIEPIPTKAARCRVQRPRSTVIQCACTDDITATRGSLKMIDCNLMSFVKGSLATDEAEQKWVQSGEACQNVKAEEVEVSCRTLTAVLDDCGAPSHIDFLSLDVEGSELPVLRGLDLHKYRPDFILVEVLITHREQIESLLGSLYDAIKDFDGHDVLYKRKDLHRHHTLTIARSV